jgi:hypothetical protein
MARGLISLRANFQYPEAPSMNKFQYFAKAATFVAKKHLMGYQVNPVPSFQPEGLEFFQTIIPTSIIYLEFGSGGSTILASKHVKKLVSVESDGVFKRAVERAIPQDTRAEIHLLAPYIGVTAEWGTPVFGRPTANRVKRWKKYPSAPWPVLNGEVPDTVLIDGRMRVACALESLLHINRHTRLIVDDYVGRDYRAIEQFAELIATHGIMAEFRKMADFDVQACRESLTRFYSVLR